MAPQDESTLSAVGSAALNPQVAHAVAAQHKAQERAVDGSHDAAHPEATALLVLNASAMVHEPQLIGAADLVADQLDPAQTFIPTASPYPAGMDLLPRLRAAAAEEFEGAGVRFAYLFGSHARGQARPDSDVDVAVHFAGDVSPEEYLERSVLLAGRLTHRSGIGPIDGLVVLNEAPLRLVGRVLRDRIVLFGQDDPVRVDYEMRMGKLAMDFEIHAAPLDRALLATMAAEGR